MITLKFLSGIFQKAIGQASLEAAFLIPLMLLLSMMLIQPAILLYNRSVMHAAASESLRVMATMPQASNKQELMKSFIIRRLGSLPEIDIFHVGIKDSWEIRLQEDKPQTKQKVSVSHRVRLLPLFDTLLRAFQVSGDGSIQQEITVESTSQPRWVQKSEWGVVPERWVKSWE